MKWIMIIFANALTFAPSLSQAQETRANIWGEPVINYSSPPVDSSNYRQEITRWECDGPVEMEIIYAARADKKYQALSVNIKVNNIPVEPDIVDQIRPFVDSASFTVHTLCQGQRPILLINYATEFVEDYNDGSATAKIRSERIYLSPPAARIE